MRIALVVPEFPPETVGGGGAVYASLAEQYRRVDEVRVFAGAGWSRGVQGPSAWWESDPSASQAIKRYTLIRDPLQLPELRSVMPPRLRSLWALNRDLRDFQPSVAHVHGLGHLFVDAAAMVLRHQRVPYVFTLHGVPVSPARMMLPARIAYLVYARTLASRTVGRACSVTSVSRSLRLPDSQRTPIWIVNGVQPKPVDPNAVRRVGALLEPCPPGSIVVAAAGRIAFSKGFDVLIDACGMIGPCRATIAIAGQDGGELTALRARAELLPPTMRLCALGRLTQDEVAALFARADVVVVPSRSEPFGLVALEAVAVGARLIVSDTGGLGETFRGSVVPTVPPGRPEALARAIRAALRAGPLSERERSDYARVLTAHAWEGIARQYLELLSDCANRERQSGR